ncbi:Ribonuclease [Quillaja saponaria]|uniref:poly(A)-specific ribonuclease n=1 Tax=Quillaja saponaria TaxID=32244 RepID=A0AAD7L5L8_QUISA|nr:Ribonuclease [Quillaja saponaria]
MAQIIGSGKKTVVVRDVWADNLKSEFTLIRELLALYPFASMDTEFPGTIYALDVDKCAYSKLHPSVNYQVMKANVDALNIIQIGLTLSDSEGNLPDLGTETAFIWEFNFCDFDIFHDQYNSDSIELLELQGIDFLKNREKGIRSSDFAKMIWHSGLVKLNIKNRSSLTWVTFHSAYDFGFLIKVIIQKELPEDIETFMNLVTFYFGTQVYDMKYMINFCDGLYGGLERVARTLRVDRVAGKSHQAGSDSLLTLQTFMKLKDVYFSKSCGDQENCCLNGFQGALYGF